MRVGIISGSGTHGWPGLLESPTRQVHNAYGEVSVTEGRVADVEVVHVSRHGAAHARLSNHVQHRANIAALKQESVDAVIAMTVCGALHREIAPGTLVVFDDLYFPGNRLPDGSLCTWYDRAGDPQRGHWIFDSPFSEPVRQALIRAGEGGETPMRTHGCYGHVDGPRFNTRREIATLAQSGVSCVSQTAAPEVVLAGEAELPLALVGFVTDYANGVVDASEPLDALLARMRASTTIFASLVEAALPLMQSVTRAGFVYRFDA